MIPAASFPREPNSVDADLAGNRVAAFVELDHVYSGRNLRHSSLVGFSVLEHRDLKALAGLEHPGFHGHRDSGDDRRSIQHGDAVRGRVEPHLLARFPHILECDPERAAGLPRPFPRATIADRVRCRTATDLARNRQFRFFCQPDVKTERARDGSTYRAIKMKPTTHLTAPASTESGGRPLEDEAYPSAGYAWYVVGVLTLAYIFSFIDRQILNLMVGPIQRDLGIGDTQMSLLMGASFAVFYTLFGIPLGRLADTRSRRAIISVGIALWSVMTVGCGLARTFWQLAFMRMGVGVGEASLSPSAYSLISDYFRPERRSTAMSVYSMGIYIGAGMAFILGGFITLLVSGRESTDIPWIGSVRSWQLIFFVVGLPGLLISLLLLTVREPVRKGVRLKSDASAITVPTSKRRVVVHPAELRNLPLPHAGHGSDRPLWLWLLFLDTCDVDPPLWLVAGQNRPGFRGDRGDRWHSGHRLGGAVR